MPAKDVTPVSLAADGLGVVLGDALPSKTRHQVIERGKLHIRWPQKDRIVFGVGIYIADGDVEDRSIQEARDIPRRHVLSDQGKHVR